MTIRILKYKCKRCGQWRAGKKYFYCEPCRNELNPPQPMGDGDYSPERADQDRQTRENSREQDNLERRAER